MTQDSQVLALRPRWGLTRYVLAATLARAADGGAVVAIVLVATASGTPGWVAGLLGASITAPHLLGPFLARRLDTARDGRKVIALACVAHGTTLAAAVLILPSVPPAATAALLFVSGLFGPFLTGGISSRLPGIAGPSRHLQRRAQGWDVATYGLGGTAGPTIVAAISVWASPTAAALILSAGAVCAAGLMLILPAQAPSAQPGQVPQPLRTLTIVATTGPLRRTLYLTIVVAMSVAALPIVAVVSTQGGQQAAGAAAALTAAYGLGSLVGSAGVMIRPLRGDADASMSWLAFVVAGALGTVLLSPLLQVSLAAYAIVGIANSYFFASTLAARSEYAPAAVRGQIFVWVGALKITAGSIGTAAAGAVASSGAPIPLALALVATFSAAVISLWDRRSTQ